MRTPIFAFWCFLGSLGWAVFITYIIAIYGAGDGSTGNAIVGSGRVFFYLPSFCLVLFITASLRFIPIRLTFSILLIADIALLVFSILCFSTGEIWLVFPLPFIGYGIAANWLLLARIPPNPSGQAEEKKKKEQIKIKQKY
jgi:hypothetical protein